MSVLSLEICMPNWKFVALTVWSYWLLTPKNLGDHVTLVTPLFEKNLRGHVRTVLYVHRHASNENSVSATYSVQ